MRVPAALCAVPDTSFESTIVWYNATPCALCSQMKDAAQIRYFGGMEWISFTS